MEDIVKRNTGIFLLLFILGFLGGTFIPMIAHNLTGLVTLGYCPDINGDGVVNVGDQLLVGGYINQTNCPTYDCDLDNDGIVTQADANLVASNADKYGYDITDCAGAFHYGALRIHTNPADILVQVYVDDVLRSTTTPVTLNNINAGTHSVKIVRSGYTDWIVSTDVQEGLLADVSFDLTTQVACSADSNCPGGAGGASSPFCLNGDLYSYYGSTKCINPGTASSYCGQVNETRLVQDCAYGCSNNACNSTPANLSCHTLGTTMYYSSANAYYIGCDIKIDTGKTDFDLSKSYCSASVTGKSAYLKPDGYGRADQYYATLTGLVANDVVSVYAWSTSQNKGVECLPRLNQQSVQSTCTDSDAGINNLTAGYVTGINSAGASYRYDDTCSGSSLSEQYCCGTSNCVAAVTCANGCNTTTNNKCNPSPVINPTCTDSDGGKNYYVYGRTNDSTGNINTDACSSSTQLREAYCANSLSQYEWINCPYGCSNGVCNQAPQNQTNQTNTTIPCVDPDNGKNYLVAAKCTDYTLNQYMTDACSGSMLREAYCSNNACKYDWVTCTYGCSNNACTNGPCTDSDAYISDYIERLKVKGNCTDYSGTKTDTATSSNFVTEYYCTGTTCGSTGYSCSYFAGQDYVAEDGACRLKTNVTPSTIPNSCTDPDGGYNIYVYSQPYGYLNGASYKYYDYCVSPNMLREFYCSGTNLASYNVACSYGCSNGVCNQASQNQTTQTNTTPTCSDSDNGIINITAGYVYGTNSQGVSYRYDDSCSGSSLSEQYCCGTSNCVAAITCANGCNTTTNNKCNAPSNALPALPANSCTDPDGGNVTGLKGATSGNYSGQPYTNTDSCLNNQILIENYCAGSMALSYQTTCTYGCSEGACNAAAQADSCTDTDGNPTGYVYSYNINVKGTASGYKIGVPYANTDYCIEGGNTLMEFYCSGINTYSHETECMYGCADGACLATNPGGCTETDNGNDIYKKGTSTAIIKGITYSYDDNCTSSTLLREYYCQNGIAYTWPQMCTYGCSNGACMKSVPGYECNDTDTGYDLYAKGTVSALVNWRPYKATDVCISPTQVTENYCSLGKPYAWNATCWYGCYDGACSQTLRDPSQITCTDSDSGINYNFKGSVTYKWFNTYSNYTDYCYNNNAALAEYYCSPDNYARISTKVCACSDGKCV